MGHLDLTSYTDTSVILQQPRTSNTRNPAHTLATTTTELSLTPKHDFTRSSSKRVLFFAMVSMASSCTNQQWEMLTDTRVDTLLPRRTKELFGTSRQWDRSMWVRFAISSSVSKGASVRLQQFLVDSFLREGALERSTGWTSWSDVVVTNQAIYMRSYPKEILLKRDHFFASLWC